LSRKLNAKPFPPSSLYFILRKDNPHRFVMFAAIGLARYIRMYLRDFPWVPVSKNPCMSQGVIIKQVQ